MAVSPFGARLTGGCSGHQANSCPSSVCKHKLLSSAVLTSGRVQRSSPFPPIQAPEASRLHLSSYPVWKDFAPPLFRFASLRPLDCRSVRDELDQMRSSSFSAFRAASRVIGERKRSSRHLSQRAGCVNELDSEEVPDDAIERS